MHEARLELWLLVDRHALVAAVLNEYVGPVTPWPFMSIHGDRSLDATSVERALVMGEAIDCATASVLPEREHVVRGFSSHRTEVGMTPKTRPAHLWQYPSVLEQTVTLGWRLGRVGQRPFGGEPRNHSLGRRLGRGGVCLPRHGSVL